MDRDPMVVKMEETEEMAHVIAGAHMARRGEPIEACPHAERTEAWFSWRSGWRRPSMYIGDPDDE